MHREEDSQQTPGGLSGLTSRAGQPPVSQQRSRWWHIRYWRNLNQLWTIGWATLARDLPLRSRCRANSTTPHCPACTEAGEELPVARLSRSHYAVRSARTALSPLLVSLRALECLAQRSFAFAVVFPRARFRKQARCAANGVAQRLEPASHLHPGKRHGDRSVRASARRERRHGGRHSIVAQIVQKYAAGALLLGHSDEVLPRALGRHVYTDQARKRP